MSEGVTGPTADIALLKESKLLERLSTHVGTGGDLARVGIDKLHPCGLGVTPRRKPCGKDRPPEDITSNRAFAKRRIPVQHMIGRLRRYEFLARLAREHRQNHSRRVRAVVGLVNRQLRGYAAA